MNNDKLRNSIDLNTNKTAENHINGWISAIVSTISTVAIWYLNAHYHPREAGNPGKGSGWILYKIVKT